MSKTELSRRDFLLRVTAAGALGLGAGSVLSACGGGESGAPAPPPESEGAAPAAQAAGGCTDVSGLTEQELNQRVNVYKYVDQTPDPEKPCSACALYVEAPEGAACGGCQLVKGPISPDGYCISFAPKQTL